MSTTDTINLSIPLDEKIQLEKIFSTYDLTINEAINLFIEASLARDFRSNYATTKRWKKPFKRLGMLYLEN